MLEGLRRIKPDAHLVLPLTVLVAAGCAAGPDAPSVDEAGAAPEALLVDVVTVSSAAAGVLECRIERGTGSHIAREVCATREERQQVSEASREWMRSGGTKGAPLMVRDPADPRED